MTATTTSGTASAAELAVPTLVGIRAAHHPTYDRIVFDFQGGLPASRTFEYVPALIADASGLYVPVAGRAILMVRFELAQAHTDEGTPTAPSRVAFGLPNIVTAVSGGDFEGVVTYGIGLARQDQYTALTLSNPDRVVIDIAAGFPTVPRDVWFFSSDRFATGQEPYFLPVTRPVLPLTPATGVVDRLFAGPTEAEKTQGLEFLASEATGFTGLTITQQVARIQLTGGCSAGGSTASIAGEIFPALKQFSTVDWVKIFDPMGGTERPTGQCDSIPFCLEP